MSRLRWWLVLTVIAGLFIASTLGVGIYFVMRARALRAGVDEKMLFTELPPD